MEQARLESQTTGATSHERADDAAMEKLIRSDQWVVGVWPAGQTAPASAEGDLFCVKHQSTCPGENSLTTLAGTSVSLTSLNSKVMLPSGATVASRYP